MVKAVIAYTGKSSVTGRALYDYMREGSVFDKIVRVMKDKRAKNVDVLIRWGNSKSEACTNRPLVEINKRIAVANASNKLNMMNLLASCEDVTIPLMLINQGVSTGAVNAVIENFKNEDGKFFARSSSGNIRLTNELRYDDAYITKPIDKDREYRVHVFGDEVLGIYEKVPNEGEVTEGLIMKDHNSQFKRCNPDVGRLRCHDEAQAMCIAAVKKLGLDFGGVDIIRERGTKKFYVVEVNSSPSLNSTNLSRYVNKFVEFIDNRVG